MTCGTPVTSVSVPRLILAPLLITLGVIALHLIWELEYPPMPWFLPAPPFLGIALLAPVFGIYFALKIARAGEAPTDVWRGLALAGLGASLVLAGFSMTPTSPDSSLTKIHWQLLLIAGGLLIQALNRPLALLNTLVAYAYTSRIAVCIYLLFAMTQKWPPQYGARISDWAVQMGLSKWAAYIVLALWPQLTTWAAFTVVIGSFFAYFALAAVRLREPAPMTTAVRGYVDKVSTILGMTSVALVVAGVILVNPRAPYKLCGWALAGLGLSPLPAVLAIVLGHIAGHKLSFASGYLSLLLLLPAFFSMTYPPCGERPFSEASSVVGSLRTINTSEVTYASTYGTGFSQSLLELDGPPGSNTADAAGLIDSVLGSGQKSGYVFDYRPGAPGPEGIINSDTVTARSSYGGHPNYFTDESGVIRQTEENRPATVNDSPLAG